MSVTIQNCCIRDLTAAHALQPVAHMRQVFITNISGWNLVVTRQRDISLLALHKRIRFVVPLLFDPFPLGTALPTNVDQCPTFSHDPAETIAVVTEAR